MLDRAWASGITTFDTAPGYGEAEARLGMWIKRRKVDPVVTTKLPSLAGVADADVGAAIAQAISASTGRLGIRPAYYLAHDAADYLKTAVRDGLRQAADRQEVGAIGVSVYTEAEVRAAIVAGPPDVIQLAVSIVDQRLASGDALTACAAAGITVFARSVFLQGALLMQADRLPRHLGALKPAIAALDALCAETNTTRVSIALRFVRDLPGMASLVIGTYDLDQLTALAAAAKEPPLSPVQKNAAADISKLAPIQLLDPRRWPPADNQPE